MTDVNKDILHDSERLKQETPGMWQDYYIEKRPFGKMSEYKDDFHAWVAYAGS
jgi:hypothetical protein